MPSATRLLRSTLRRVHYLLPAFLKFAIYRTFVECDPAPSDKLVLKIADTKEELEACFRLLHDAYVASGFMKRDPSGMRVTVYHALPTTTTLCAKYAGEVVGTLSLIRESELGFPLQKAFDLSGIRAKKGKIAEVSALAIHRKFRKTGGSILFPLMKFMYNYCTTSFDTKHLVIAVNPKHIGMYESLLFFKRLQESVVQNYDFANGAPAIGAHLDLREAPGLFKAAYGGKSTKRDLHRFFVQTDLPNVKMPNRRYFTTNDPVMTPDLLDYFFNEKTKTFAHLAPSDAGLLHSIYNLDEYRHVLPQDFTDTRIKSPLNDHQRYSLKCPGRLTVQHFAAGWNLQVIELSDDGFVARTRVPLPVGEWGRVDIELGPTESSMMQCKVVRGNHDGASGMYFFKVPDADSAWKKFVAVLKFGATHEDMEYATKFLSI